MWSASPDDRPGGATALDAPASGDTASSSTTKDNVWLTGNGNGDGQVLKFTKDGKFACRSAKAAHP